MKRKIMALCKSVLAVSLVGVVMTAGAFLVDTAAVPVHAGLIRKDLWLGDVDEDGKVTLKDASITLKHALNLQQLDVYETFICDVDGNEKIELNDAKETLKTALNLKEKHRMGTPYSDSWYMNYQVDEGRIAEPKAKWLYFGDEPMQESMLEGFSDYIKTELVGLNPGPFHQEPVAAEISEKTEKERVDKEKLRNAVAFGMVPVHTNQMEDLDYIFLIKDNGDALFYVVEQNPLDDKKEYYLSAFQKYVVPTTMDVRIIGCYVRQK